MEPKFFKAEGDFRKWLEKNHASKKELLVGFYKTGSGRKSITWPQSVDQALCYGWIDGVRRSIDDHSYSIRFTPRKKDSHWSAVNLKKIESLSEKGLMKPAGEATFLARNKANVNRYSFETAPMELSPAFTAAFKKNKTAWAWFKKTAPWYQRTATHWVMSAKREITRQKRSMTLISDSARGSKIKMLAR